MSEPTFAAFALTDPTDGPRATIQVSNQWASGSKPKLVVRGQPGEGAFVEFTADQSTIDGLRDLAVHLDEMLNNRVGHD